MAILLAQEKVNLGNNSKKLHMSMYHTLRSCMFRFELFQTFSLTSEDSSLAETLNKYHFNGKL